MTPDHSNTTNLPDVAWTSDWVVDDTLPPYVPPRDLEEPPLEQLHEDDWAWLLSYKHDECYELRSLRDPRNMAWRARHPLQDRQAIETERTFQYVKSMYDQGKPPTEWKGAMPSDAGKFVYLNKRCSEAQKEYLDAVASGEITVNFPDPADEAERHRGR